MSAKNFSGLGQRPALVEFHIEDDPEYRAMFQLASRKAQVFATTVGRKFFRLKSQ
jgi:hypothetical protein